MQKNVHVFQANDLCVLDYQNSVFTRTDCPGVTGAVFQMPWSEKTNRGVHELKVKCLKIGHNAVGIGMVTKKTVKTANNQWLFDLEQCGSSYQLYDWESSTTIFYTRNGRQQYKESVDKNKLKLSKWNSTKDYGPRETMSMIVDFRTRQLTFYINSNKVGK
eukprot:373584_1